MPINWIVLLSPTLFLQMILYLVPLFLSLSNSPLVAHSPQSFCRPLNPVCL
uniref:Uncharacterized protein n=1 Tax=Rhizophora mucronata TaxID=61149 RepID=A0A2P2P289_RHIMU